MSTNFQIAAVQEGNRFHGVAKRWLQRNGFKVLKEHIYFPRSGLSCDFLVWSPTQELELWEAKGGRKPLTAGLRRSAAVQRLLGAAAEPAHRHGGYRLSFNVITTALPKDGTRASRLLERAQETGKLNRIVVVGNQLEGGP